MNFNINIDVDNAIIRYFSTCELVFFFYFFLKIRPACVITFYLVVIDTAK